jgi:SAM-dependent methyltransferase
MATRTMPSRCAIACCRGCGKEFTTGVKMGDKKPEVSDPEPSYFELQAYVGTTKHMGGFETTKALIELCHINKDTYVLDAGCGVGATACYLAKRYGCSVVGVDISEGSVWRTALNSG